MKRGKSYVFVSAMTCLILLSMVIGVQTAQPYSVDESSPIGKKWVKLGGQSVVGDPTSKVLPTPFGKGEYQTFEEGVIIYSKDWGAIFISPAIFAKWLKLDAETTPNGKNLLQYVGYPTEDYVSSSTSEIGYFERGMIVVAENNALVVHGLIYAHYRRVSMSSAMGLPVTEQAAAPGGGRFQSFQGGDIYWRSDIGAFAVQGAIRQRWLDLNGAAGPLGYPMSDENAVISNGVSIGRSSRFENGAIYYSEASGAWELMGKILEKYEKMYGGPAGWLGFPTSGQNNTPESGGVFNNFQNGVLVYHNAGPYSGVYAFNDLKLYIQRLEGSGEDCWEGICGQQDLYSYITVYTSWAGKILDIRRPEEGDYGSGHDLNETFYLVPVVQGDLVIDIAMSGWDSDLSPNDDDLLGSINQQCKIDNLWCFFEPTDHQNNDFKATFSLKREIPFDRTDFRGNLFWSFSNFITPQLTYDQYAETFTDVNPDESSLFNPFNQMYYGLFYERIAKNGNCFGMCLESIYAEKGYSLFSEPINQFSLGQNTIDEINIKHGYQLGAGSLDWVLGQFMTGSTHDPKRVFNESRAYFEMGDDPVITMCDGVFSSTCHAVRPYHWDDYSDPDKWIINIANPNYPAPTYGDNHSSCRIEINAAENHFSYIHNSNETWSGGTWLGGRMTYIPAHVLYPPQTPFWPVVEAILEMGLFFVGDTGQTLQITDAQNRSFYEPGLNQPPTRWDQITQDSQTRIPNLARIPLSGQSTGNKPLELYYVEGTGATYMHEIAPAPGVPAGTPYQWGMNSGTLAARLQIPGTPGGADRITTKAIGTDNQAVVVTIAPNGQSKKIEWTMAGPVKHRWMELTDLQLIPGQSITMKLKNSGLEADFENDGPPTSANLRVSYGRGATPVVVGAITIGSGTTASFQYDTPHTTLTYTGTSGENGWLISPATVTLTAKDYSGSGIKYIEDSKDSVNWARYTSPFQHTDEGMTTLYYRAMDNMGNQEAAESQGFKIDTRPPVVTVSTNKLIYTRVEPVTVHYNASDPAPGSGMASLSGVFDNNEPVTDGQILSMLWRALGTHTITITAMDNAGLVKTGNTSFQLIVSSAGLDSTIQLLRQLGEISSDGVAKSLRDQLSAATAALKRGQKGTMINLLSAMINYIKAQQGKFISERAAQLLIGDVGALQKQ